MGVAPEEVLKSGCIGNEFKEDVDLSLILKAVAHLNHSRVLQLAHYFYFPEDPPSFGWLD